MEPNIDQERRQAHALLEVFNAVTYAERRIGTKRISTR